MLILTLGWRNVWRNPRRSLLSIGAVAVAFAVLLVLESLRAGMARQMLDNGTLLLLGHLQVHDAAYLPDRGLHDTIGGPGGCDPGGLLAAVEAVPGVEAASPRVHGFGLLSTGARSSGARLLGVDPLREARVTRLLTARVEGADPGDDLRDGVLLGQTLAEELGVRVGAHLAVVTAAADGSVGNELLVVRGILLTGLASLDRSLAVMGIGALQGLLALPARRIHEVAARLASPGESERVAAALAASGRLPAGARARSWQRLEPALVDYLALLRGWSWVMVAVIGTFAALGVLNTMLMAVFERTREIGMLASLGLRPPEILAMVLFETLVLTGIGMLGGAGLGGAGMAYLVWHGWDLSRWTSGLTVAGVLIDPVLRGAVTGAGVSRSALGLTAITLLAALLPARRAAALRPIEALAAPGP